MAIDTSVPPEVAAEYKKMEGQKNMNPDNAEEGNIEAEKELDIGDFIRDSQSKDVKVVEAAARKFVERVKTREGGDPTKVEAAIRMLRFGWLDPLREKTMTADAFAKGVYDSVASVLKPKLRKELSPAEETEAIRIANKKAQSKQRIAEHFKRTG